MKAWKFFKTVLPFLLAAALVAVCAFYPKEKAETVAPRVVRVWNVDTFEGGKGSRTSFLKSVARRVEEGAEGLYFLVTSLTEEGARQAFLGGERPDLLSFGVGLSEFAECALPLPYHFAGGELGGHALAYPWCAGRYYLFSLTDDFGGEGKTAISCGGSNLPALSAAVEGIAGEELPSLTAYTRFLGGEFRYLLGTQRDVCRFLARGVTVYSKPLDGYCDLFQYISVLSAEKREDCLLFLGELLSARTQEALSSLGMFPPAQTAAKRTPVAFLSAEGREELLAAVRSGKNPEKFLKSI